MNLRHRLGQLWLTLTMRSSGQYWEQRYRLGLSSGDGSEGKLAAYKADVLNRFVAERGIRSVIELGCGDGQQLALANYPSYLGFDVSARAIDLCRRQFGERGDRSFLWYDPLRSVGLGNFLQADLTMSLDVIYHLVEDDVYLSYLHDLFSMSRRFVAVYSSNRNDGGSLRHVRHRQFVDDVAATATDFKLIHREPNPHHGQTFAEFYFFERLPSTSR